MKTDSEMREMLRKAVLKAGGQTAWCKKHYDGHTQYISDILAGKKNVTIKVAKVLGYERVWRKQN